MVRRGKGAFLWDVEGRRYLDFVMSWGPLIFGHADPGVRRAVAHQIRKGLSYGAPTENETVLAQLIHEAFPSMEQVRLVSSGTEAVMSAIRLARGVSGRKKVVKCDGGYHGHVDSLLVRAGSGAASFGVPDSLGVPEELAELTLSVPYNDTEALRRLFQQEGEKIACLIIEPIPANMGVVLPRENYLSEIRALTQKYGILLVFDEVVTGLRVARGGAGERYGVRADLVCLGKVLGGGLPIAAFGGRRDVMSRLAPAGGVYQAGTLSGNPLVTAVAIETLERLARPGFYQRLEARCEPFYMTVESAIKKDGLGVTLNRIGSCFTLFFTEGPVVDFQSARRTDTRRYARFFHELLERGIYFAPSQFEANFISTAHTSKLLSGAAKTIVEAVRTVVNG